MRYQKLSKSVRRESKCVSTFVKSNTKKSFSHNITYSDISNFTHIVTNRSYKFLSILNFVSWKKKKLL